MGNGWTWRVTPDSVAYALATGQIADQRAELAAGAGAVFEHLVG